MQPFPNVIYICHLVTLPPYLVPNAEHCECIGWYFLYRWLGITTVILLLPSISRYALFVNPDVTQPLRAVRQS